MTKLLKIFIGFDRVETIAWHVMAHSIYTRSSIPVSIIPLTLTSLSDHYWRERDPRQSNDFSFSRFLVPHLSDFSGWSIFFDCDMLLRVDIAEIFNEINNQPNKAVYVVKHDYCPASATKYLGNVQYQYPRKNWSSVILWNCNHPKNKTLTKEFVNSVKAEDLHRFKWLQDEEIGELDIRWNWLVGEYKNPPPDVKNIHWTVGGPYFHEFKDAEFSEEWNKEFLAVNYCKQL